MNTHILIIFCLFSGKGKRRTSLTLSHPWNRTFEFPRPEPEVRGPSHSLRWKSGGRLTSSCGIYLFTLPWDTFKFHPISKATTWNLCFVYSPSFWDSASICCLGYRDRCNVTKINVNHRLILEECCWIFYEFPPILVVENLALIYLYFWH